MLPGKPIVMVDKINKVDIVYMMIDNDMVNIWT